MKKTRNLLGAGLALGIVALQSGCAGTATVAQSAAKPEAIPQSASTAKPALDQGIQRLSGKVVETMDVNGYTYVNLEKDGKKSWAAVPLTKVTVGQEIEVLPGVQMGKFTSNVLKRSFDEIVFSSGLVTDAKSPLPSNATTQPKGHMGMMGQPGNGMAAISGKVVETMDSGGYTYICLENGGKKVWAAVPTMNVSVGQELKLQPGQEMTNFKSKSLNRSFDRVIFSGGVLPATK
jgi:hypothetical protein